MKKGLLLLALLIISFCSFGQKHNDNNTWFNFGGSIRFSGPLRVPKDTITGTDTGQIGYKNGRLYLKDQTGYFKGLAMQSEIGSGSYNSNIGSGFRWAVPGTNNVKTFFQGFGVILDSTSNTNGLTAKVDSAALFVHALRRKDSTAGGYYPYSSNPKFYIVAGDTATMLANYRHWLAGYVTIRDRFGYSGEDVTATSARTFYTNQNKFTFEGAGYGNTGDTVAIKNNWFLLDSGWLRQRVYNAGGLSNNYGHYQYDQEFSTSKWRHFGDYKSGCTTCGLNSMALLWYQNASYPSGGVDTLLHTMGAHNGPDDHHFWLADLTNTYSNANRLVQLEHNGSGFVRFYNNPDGNFAQSLFGKSSNSPNYASVPNWNNWDVIVGGKFAVTDTARLSGKLKYTAGSPASNSVLSSDAVGNASWSTLAAIGGVTGSGTTNRVIKFTGASTIGNSRFYDDGTYAGVDDVLNSTTTTTAYNFISRNNYAGDLTSNIEPHTLIASQSSTIADLNLLWLKAPNMPANSRVFMALGKNNTTKNTGILEFHYQNNSNDSNHIEFQFAGVNNAARIYPNRRMTIGNVTWETGHTLEVGGKTKINDTLFYLNPLNLTKAGKMVDIVDTITGAHYRIPFDSVGGTGGGGTNIYNSNGTLTGARTVDQDGNAITWEQGAGFFILNSNVGIGTISPDSVFQVNGSLKFVTGRQGAGKVLTSDANGGADWVTPSTGSGTVNTGIANKAAYYPSGGTTVDDVAGAEFNGTNKILQLTAQAATDVPLTITPHGSQSANLLNIGTLVNWNNNGDQYVEDRQVYYKYTGNIKGGWHPTQIGFIVTPGQGYGFSDADNFNTIDGSIMRSGAGVLKVIAGGLGVTTKGDLEVLNEAYNATTWNGSEEVPTKDAVRDKIEAILSPDYSRLVKTLNVNVTDAGNVGTGEDDLMSFTVPADTLSTNGDYIDFEMTVTFAANSNNKNVKLYWGGTQFYTTGAAAQNSGNMIFRGKIIRTGATTQKIMLTQASNTLSFVDETTNTTGSATLSSANILKATGEATSNNDIVQTSLTVVFNRNH